MTNYSKSVTAGFFCAALLTTSSCADQSDKSVAVNLIEGVVIMNVPAAWTQHDLPFSSCDAIGEACFGQGKDSKMGVAGLFINGFIVEVRKKLPQSVAAIKQEELKTLILKNPGAEIISVDVDKQANSLTVDCTGNFELAYPRFFFRYKLLIHDGEWVRFNFRGIDTPMLRRTIERTTQTIIINSSSVAKRRKPCREIKI